MKPAIMTKTKKYKFGKVLPRDTKVMIREIDFSTVAYLSKNDVLGFGVTRKDFKYLEPMKTTTELLIDFVNQKPGLDARDYSDSKSYNAESREITKDRSDFYELFALASVRLGGDLDRKLKERLSNTDDRLHLNAKGGLQYDCGQYFPTEYRPAACRILTSLIWDDYREERAQDGIEPLYKDGHAIRKAIHTRLSNRVSKLYFN